MFQENKKEIRPFLHFIVYGLLLCVLYYFSIELLLLLKSGISFFFFFNTNKTIFLDKVYADQ